METDKQTSTNETYEKPLVSVNICTYNRANLIHYAIKGVFEQNYPNLEIIIADNGNDETETITKEILKENPEWQNKIHYYKNDTVGISENRNFALQKSAGKYIAVLDSDDYWTSPEKIIQQVEFLEENTDHALVGTNTIIVDENNEKIDEIKNETTNEKIHQNFLLKNNLVHSSVLFKKGNFPEYDEEIFIWEDYEVFLKIARKNKVANLPGFMTAYKKHRGNISQSKKIKGILTLEKIIKENKNYYPNYYKARLKNVARLLKAILPF